MKLSCKVIEDMLPMYYDKVCSEESALLVEEHLKECPHCSQMLTDLGGDNPIPEQELDDMKPLQKIQKSYKKMRIRWLIAIVAVMLLIPAAFLIGNKHNEKTVDYTKEEAIAYANEFMTCLVRRDYAKAYTYWDITREKEDLLSGKIVTEEDIANFEADGLKKFCQGGEKLETWGGITDFQFEKISAPNFHNSEATAEYLISYTVKFDGKDESFSVSLSKHGIDSISSGDGLIRHPLSHLTLWVQWVVDDYQGRYYDFDLGQWVDISKEN